MSRFDDTSNLGDGWIDDDQLRPGTKRFLNHIDKRIDDVEREIPRLTDAINELSGKFDELMTTIRRISIPIVVAVILAALAVIFKVPLG